MVLGLKESTGGALLAFKELFIKIRNFITQKTGSEHVRCYAWHIILKFLASMICFC